MNEIKLPFLVDALFDNQQLELIRTLCILSCFPKNKKGIDLSELTYYYAFSVSEFEFGTGNEQNELRYNVVNLYVDYQSKVKRLVILLSNMNYIEVIGDIKVQISDIRVKMHQEGYELVNDMKNDYFHKLIKDIAFIKEKFAYSKTIEKQLLERGIL